MQVYVENERKAEPLLITAKRAAELLNISTRHLYTLTKRGQIRAKLIGRKVMYRMADIQRFIDDDSGVSIAEPS
jgi:excisionase family DNA binding protein